MSPKFRQDRFVFSCMTAITEADGGANQSGLAKTASPQAGTEGHEVDG